MKDEKSEKRWRKRGERENERREKYEKGSETVKQTLEPLGVWLMKNCKWKWTMISRIIQRTQYPMWILSFLT